MTHFSKETPFTDEEILDCDAYNAAFYELGFRWHWDMDAYLRIRPNAEGMLERIQAYLLAEQPHLLKAYDAAFLVRAIVDAKERHRSDRVIGTDLPHIMKWMPYRALELGA